MFRKWKIRSWFKYFVKLQITKKKFLRFSRSFWEASRSTVDPFRSYLVWIFRWFEKTFLITTRYVSSLSTVSLYIPKYCGRSVFPEKNINVDFSHIEEISSASSKLQYIFRQFRINYLLWWQFSVKTQTDFLYLAGALWNFSLHINKSILLSYVCLTDTKHFYLIQKHWQRSAFKEVND